MDLVQRQNELQSPAFGEVGGQSGSTGYLTGRHDPEELRIFHKKIALNNHCPAAVNGTVHSNGFHSSSRIMADETSDEMSRAAEVIEDLQVPRYQALIGTSNNEKM